MTNSEMDERDKIMINLAVSMETLLLRMKDMEACLNEVDFRMVEVEDEVKYIRSYSENPRSLGQWVSLKKLTGADK